MSPTIVAAAFDIPMKARVQTSYANAEGNRFNRITSKLEMMRTSPIQLAMPMKT
jgi:hypothetical protein